MVTFLNKESLTTKLTLIIVGLTAGSSLLIPATYASFHPVTSGEIADNTIRSADIQNGQVSTADIGQGQVRTGDILDDTITSADIANPVFMKRVILLDGAQGWDPNGARQTFVIFDPDNNAEDSIIIVLTNNGGVICAAGDLAIATDQFEVNCESPPPPDAELHYAIIQIPLTATIAP
jgi:hypothetical protein